MKYVVRAIFFAVLVFLIPAIPGITTLPVLTFAQTNEQYFDETGYTVRGDFLTYFQSVKDPLQIFGYPITDEIQDASSGRTVQYFQRARLERNSRGAVEMAPLGKLLYDQKGTPVTDASNSMACRKFPATGFNVCYAFLRFYDDNKGPNFFGNPISNIELRDGRYVQYFEKVRLEWRPEMPAGERVVLADLGRIYYDSRVGVVYDPEKANGSSIIMTTGQVKLQTHAFVSQALIPANKWQSIYVVVQDQNFAPVKDAMVIVSVYFPDGSQYDVRMPATDANGISTHSFMVKDMPVKQIVRVDVNVEYQGEQSQASTWFRIWW
jgi:hypothetical protein